MVLEDKQQSGASAPQMSKRSALGRLRRHGMYAGLLQYELQRADDAQLPAGAGELRAGGHPSEPAPSAPPAFAPLPPEVVARAQASEVPSARIEVLFESSLLPGLTRPAQLAALLAAASAPPGSVALPLVLMLLALEAFRMLPAPCQVDLLEQISGPEARDEQGAQRLTQAWEARRALLWHALSSPEFAGAPGVLAGRLVAWLDDPTVPVCFFKSQARADRVGLAIGSITAQRSVSYGIVRHRVAFRRRCYAVQSPDPVIAADWRSPEGMPLRYQAEILRLTPREARVLVTMIEQRVCVLGDSGLQGEPSLGYLEPGALLSTVRTWIKQMTMRRGGAKSTFGELLGGRDRAVPRPPPTADQLLAWLASVLAGPAEKPRPMLFEHRTGDSAAGPALASATFETSWD